MKDKLRGLLRELSAALFDWRLGGLLGAYLVLMLLGTQFPFAYMFIAGHERGDHSDLPYLRNFLAAEASGPVSDMQRWRWSRSEAEIVVPGVGVRSVLVGMNILSHRAQWEPGAPPTLLQITPGQAEPLAFTLGPEGRRYTIAVPAHALAQEGGTLRLGLATASWKNSDDRRDNLGIAIGEAVVIESIAPRVVGFVWPELGLLLWLPGLALCWLALRVLRFPARSAFWLLLPLALAIPLLLPLAAPRIAWGNLWALQMGLLTLAAALVSLAVVPPLLRRLDMLPPPVLLRWLLLCVVVGFVVKYGVRLYPEAMPGDLQMHVNRANATAWGQIYVMAQHRGLPFPFPNAFYLMMTPFRLLGLSGHFVIVFGNALLEATAPVLCYLLAARASGRQSLGVIAAAAYTLMPASFMTTWFTFATQVAALFFTLLLVVLLVFWWPQRRDGFAWWVVVLVMGQVFLGHIGPFMNIGLVGLLVVPLLWRRARSAEERRGAFWLLSAGLVAGVFAVIFYYTTFIDLFFAQLATAGTEGMNVLTERRAIPRATSLAVLWQGGLIQHLGFFGGLMAIPGALAISGVIGGAGERLRGSILPPLIWLCLLVSGVQAAMPFVTLNSITTRWLMSSFWAFTLCAAWAVPFFWRRGWAARVVVFAMAGFVAWQTIGVWLDAMMLRLPPIEPF